MQKEFERQPTYEMSWLLPTIWLLQKIGCQRVYKQDAFRPKEQKEPKRSSRLAPLVLKLKYPTAECQYSETDKTLSCRIEVVMKIHDQSRNGESKTCGNPVAQRGKDDDRSKGKTFSESRPVQGIIGVIGGLRNQHNITLGFDMVDR